MTAFRYIAIFCLFLLPEVVSAQPAIADLSAGDWYKLSVGKNGVYRIDHSFLRGLGIDPSRIDPSRISIFGNPGGMLPQPNAAVRPAGPEEIPIFVSGGSDGKFDRQDFLLFYGEGPDRMDFDTGRGIHFYESNLYSEANFYFLNVGGSKGMRMSTSADLGTGFPVISTFHDLVYHEEDEYNDQRSGREWFGEKFGVSTNEHTFTFPVEGISPSSPIRLVSDVMGQSHTNAVLNLTFNGVAMGEQTILPVPNSRYGVKGLHRRDTFLVDPTAAGAGAQVDQTVKYVFSKGSGFSQAYLDFLLLSFERKLKVYSGQTLFFSSASRSNAVSRFEISSAEAGVTVWDITDHHDVKIQDFKMENGVAAFSTATDRLKKFIVFDGNRESPGVVGKIPPQRLRGIDGSTDMVIVAHPMFRDEALRLAAHRAAFSNRNVAVVTPEEVYNEFSGGRQDVTAIRDFAKYLHDRNPGGFSALLLFGKASYDYKDRVPNNTNFVVTYESRNSLHPLQTFSSDDYFGFLEADEGEWREGPFAQSHTLDIGVGRLPVKTVAEARNIVDKIIDYDRNRKTFGYWRKQIVFVADDGNNEDGFTSLHQSQADELATFTENTAEAPDARKLYMGVYQKTVKPNGESVPAFTDDIIRAFDTGALIINYTGHGSEIQWADENVFNTSTISELDNTRYPFMVTATCEFGRHDDPGRISGAEHAVNAPHAGVVGLVTSARDVNAIPNFNLNIAFYEALFEREGNYYLPLGEVFRRTKNNSTSGVSNRNFSLLADPSQTLALPPHIVQITELKTATGSDTLKALSAVTARGEIRTFSGEKLTSFNGTVIATLFDKKTTFATTGKNDPAFTYEAWDNALFRGQATVKDGAFAFEFMMPKNISYQTDYGRFSLYAADTARRADASGVFTGFRIGGSEAGVQSESFPPAITVFIGDTTFINGGITNPDTDLIVRLTDNSGINISGYGIGNSLIAVLDDDAQSFVLNDYFISSPDDHTSGWIRFPLKDLPSGRHTIRVTAWDVFNNAAEGTVDFFVTDGQDIVIESFGNYPNPFRDNTTLFFTHNRSGDDLQAVLHIQNAAGQLIKSFEFTLPESHYQVDLVDVGLAGPFDKKLPAGLYLARLIVRSLTNGSKYEQVTKLIMLN